MKKNIGACLALSLSLTGCSHNLYLVGRTNGTTGHAKIATRPGMGGGDVEISLGEKVYKGRWSYMESGGSLAFGTATAFLGARSATVSGTAVDLPTGGNGTILASSTDGLSLRCVFNYSEWNSSGIGECRDGAGQTYDLQIS